jgi:hypothetical protein
VAFGGRTAAGIGAATSLVFAAAVFSLGGRTVFSVTRLAVAAAAAARLLRASLSRSFRHRRQRLGLRDGDWLTHRTAAWLLHFSHFSLVLASCAALGLYRSCHGRGLDSVGFVC